MRYVRVLCWVSSAQGTGRIENCYCCCGSLRFDLVRVFPQLMKTDKASVVALRLCHKQAIAAVGCNTIDRKRCGVLQRTAQTPKWALAAAANLWDEV